MPGTLVWLALLVVLAIVAARILRRMGQLAAGTHELDRFQRDVRFIDGRLTAVVRPLVAGLDDLRRMSGDPESLSASLPAAQAELESVVAAARALRPPAQLTLRARRILDEVERANRAADHVAHGLRTLLGGRSVSHEAQTSLKRGALNLRHARDAVALVSAEVAAMTPSQVAAMPVPPVPEARSGSWERTDADVLEEDVPDGS